MVDFVFYVPSRYDYVCYMVRSKKKTRGPSIGNEVPQKNEAGGGLWRNSDFACFHFRAVPICAIKTTRPATAANYARICKKKTKFWRDAIRQKSSDRIEGFVCSARHFRFFYCAPCIYFLSKSFAPFCNHAISECTGKICSTIKRFQDVEAGAVLVTRQGRHGAVASRWRQSSA